MRILYNSDNSIYIHKPRNSQTDSIHYAKIASNHKNEDSISFQGRKTNFFVGLGFFLSIIFSSIPIKNDSNIEKKKEIEDVKPKTGITEKYTGEANTVIDKDNGITLNDNTTQNINRQDNKKPVKMLYEQTGNNRNFLTKEEVLAKAKEINPAIEEYNIKSGAPSPVITVFGIKLISKIVVDKSQFRTFIYDDNGKFIKKYNNATGKLDTPTSSGIKYVTRVVVHPYKDTGKPNMVNTPNAFGPKAILALTVNSRTGSVNDNGQYFHGTNEPKSIGKQASHGCVRHNNNDILEIVEYVNSGDFINVIE